MRPEERRAHRQDPVGRKKHVARELIQLFGSDDLLDRGDDAAVRQPHLEAWSVTFDLSNELELFSRGADQACSRAPLSAA